MGIRCDLLYRLLSTVAAKLEGNCNDKNFWRELVSFLHLYSSKLNKNPEQGVIYWGWLRIVGIWPVSYIERVWNVWDRLTVSFLRPLSSRCLRCKFYMNITNHWIKEKRWSDCYKQMYSHLMYIMLEFKIFNDWIFQSSLLSNRPIIKPRRIWPKKNQGAIQ